MAALSSMVRPCLRVSGAAATGSRPRTGASALALSKDNHLRGFTGDSSPVKSRGRDNAERYRDPADVSGAFSRSVAALSTMVRTCLRVTGTATTGSRTRTGTTALALFLND